MLYFRNWDWGRNGSATGQVGLGRSGAPGSGTGLTRRRGPLEGPEAFFGCR